MAKEPERKDGDVDKMIDDLEAHSVHDELPGSDESMIRPDTDNCTGTCTCPCEDL